MTDFENYFEVNKQTIEFLIKQIYNYYPIGIVNYRLHDYSGYDKINEIMKSKFENIIVSESSSINILKKDLATTFGKESVTDLFHYEFPSYLLEISIKKSDFEDYKLSTNIIIVVSELVDYYTIYFEDFYRFKNYNGGFQPNLKIQSFLKKIDLPNYKDYVTKIVILMKKYLPQKSYLYNHSIQHKIINGSSPYLIDINYLQNHDGIFSIFDFLFSSANIEFAGSIQKLH